MNDRGQTRTRTYRFDIDHLEDGLCAGKLRYGGLGRLDAAPALVRRLLDAEMRLHPLEQFSLQRSALCFPRARLSAPL